MSRPLRSPPLARGLGLLVSIAAQGLLALGCLALGSPALAQQLPPAPPAVSIGQPLSFEELDDGVALRCDVVEGLDQVSLWLAVDGGAAHDPAEAGGLAAVLAALTAKALEVEGALVSPGVFERHWLVGVTAPAARAVELRERLAAWFGGAARSFDDAELVLVRDRVLLRADDEARVLPGPMLRAAAQRLAAVGGAWEIGAERPFGGDPADLEELDVAGLRTALAARLRPGRLAVAVLVGSEAEATAWRGALAGLPAPQTAGEPLRRVAAGGASPEAIRTHELVDAPFVTAAVPAPRYGEEDFLPFLVAMEAARMRVGRNFQPLRGGELRAEFPPCAWDPMAGFRLVLFQRRGRDGDSVDRVRAEVASALAGLRTAGAATPEIRAGLQVLFEQLRLPADYDDRTRELLRNYPRRLHMSTRVVLAYRLNGWPADLRAALSRVPVTHVQRTLVEALEADRLVWVGVRPDR